MSNPVVESIARSIRDLERTPYRHMAHGVLLDGETVTPFSREMVKIRHGGSFNADQWDALTAEQQEWLIDHAEEMAAGARTCPEYQRFAEGIRLADEANRVRDC